MTEQAAREAIVRCGAALWKRRLVTGTSGNISARIEGGDILVTPSGRSLRNLHADEIVRLDASGRPQTAGHRPTSELPLHLAAYVARPDAGCIVHAHPTYVVVWSKVGSVFPRDTVGARETLRDVAWTAFRPNGSVELANLCAQEFARGFDSVIMERHGLSTIGTTLDDAFDQVDLAEEAARLAYFSRLANLE